MVDTCSGSVGMRLHLLLPGTVERWVLTSLGLRPFQDLVKAVPLWPAVSKGAQGSSQVATPGSPAGTLS